MQRLPSIIGSSPLSQTTPTPLTQEQIDRFNQSLSVIVTSNNNANPDNNETVSNPSPTTIGQAISISGITPAQYSSFSGVNQATAQQIYDSANPQGRYSNQKIPGTQVTWSSLSSTPGMYDYVKSNSNQADENGNPLPNAQSPAQVLATAVQNPNSIVENYLQNQLTGLVVGASLGYLKQAGQDDATTNYKNAIAYLGKNGVSVNDIQTLTNNAITEGENRAASQNANSGNIVSKILNSPTAVVGIVASALVPTMAGEIAPTIASALSLNMSVTADALIAKGVATALLSAGVQMAEGVPQDQAIKNAAINSLITTGSNEVALKINELQNTVSPAVINALTSGGGGAVLTLANGGTAQQAMTNAVAGAAASTAGTVAQNVGLNPTTSNVIAGATGGALTAGGGPVGAVTGALSGYMQGVLPAGTIPVTLQDGSTGYITNQGVVYNKDGTINQESSVNRTITNAPGTQVASLAGGYTLSNVNTPEQLASAGIALPQGYSLASNNDPNAVLVNLSGGQSAWVTQTDPNAPSLPPAAAKLTEPMTSGIGINLADLDSKSLQGLTALIDLGKGGGGAQGSSADFNFIGTVNGTPIFSSNGVQFALVTVNGSPSLQDQNGTNYYLSPGVETQLNQLQTLTNQSVTSNSDMLPSINSKSISEPTKTETTTTTETTPGATSGGGETSGGSTTGGNAGEINTTGSTAYPVVTLGGKDLGLNKSIIDLINQFLPTQTETIPSVSIEAPSPSSQTSAPPTGTTGGGTTGTTGGGTTGTTGGTTGTTGTTTNTGITGGTPGGGTQGGTTGGATGGSSGGGGGAVGGGGGGGGGAVGGTSLTGTPGGGATSLVGTPGGGATTVVLTPGGGGGSGTTGTGITGGTGGTGSGGTGTGTSTGGGGGVGTGGGGGGSGGGTGGGTGGGGGIDGGTLPPVSSFDPNLYIYGNVPKNLGTTLPVLPINARQPLTGQTQGLGGGAAGGVSVESDKPQQAVWNISSLKLDPKAEGEEKDYGNLSTALGI
jgi:hypothetical protein